MTETSPTLTIYSLRPAGLCRSVASHHPLASITFNDSSTLTEVSSSSRESAAMLSGAQREALCLDVHVTGMALTNK